jgi:hypothetical protein
MTIKITTEDRVIVQKGDTVYNYYDMWPGTIMSDPDDQGWFYVQPLEGVASSRQRALLNGARICSMKYARSRGFRNSDVDDAPIVVERRDMGGTDTWLATFITITRNEFKMLVEPSKDGEGFVARDVCDRGEGNTVREALENYFMVSYLCNTGGIGFCHIMVTRVLPALERNIDTIVTQAEHYLEGGD